MTEPQDSVGNRPALERLLATIPGFRGYFEREYRRDSDELQRKWLAERLQRSKRALDTVARSLIDAAHLDLLPQIDRLRARLDALLGRIRGAMRGYSGFFDTVQIDPQLLEHVYDYDSQLAASVDQLAGKIEQLPSQPDQLATALPQVLADCDALHVKWDGREDLLKGIGQHS